eukprot:1161392-Pelagomonas_calceolata.AAC.24
MSVVCATIKAAAQNGVGDHCNRRMMWCMRALLQKFRILVGDNCTRRMVWRMVKREQPLQQMCGTVLEKTAASTWSTIAGAWYGVSSDCSSSVWREKPKVD